MKTLRGVAVSPGRVAGPVVAMPAPLPEPALKRLPKDSDLEDYAKSVHVAARRVADDLDEKAETATGTAADLLLVTAAMASDPTLATDAARRVVEDRETPERAVWDAAQVIIEQIEDMGGPLAERARDVRDVRDRIIAVLAGRRAPGVPDPGHPFILVAGDLAPADAAMLDAAHCLAIVTESGGPTSHTAIMARALGIPALVASKGLDELSDGEIVVVDGDEGILVVGPTEEFIAQVTYSRPLSIEFSGRDQTSDGVHVELLANVVDKKTAKAALEAKAEGVGLFRTEYLFRGEPDEPEMAEQVAYYRPVFKRFKGRKVVVRTLDVGSDKPLPYLVDYAWKGGDHIGGAKGWKGVREPNPALGVRGLRTAVQHPDVLDRQLEAMVKAAAGTDAEVWALAPMVSTPDEAAWFAERCRSHGIAKAGAMIEVPAAALTARWIAEAVDFLAVGTNDLTSYAMAADRDLGALAELTSPWQPGHLALIAAACQGARDAGGRPISVCGEAASDPYLAPVLVGLGATSLSMGPPALGEVAAVLGSVTLARCRELARIATSARDAVTARRLVREALPELV